MIRILALVVSLFFSLPAVSQLLKGKVVDQSGAPIVGANVVVEGTGVGTSTDVDGEFAIETNGPVSGLKITSVGFETVRLSSESFKDSLADGIVMREDFYQLPEVTIERSTLTGGLSGVGSVPGSAHYLNLAALNKFNYSDVNRVLRNVPGLNIQEEDGFGLRPNIGMRGTGVERSSKITLMEDGILMAPAPYTAPSAYYFPSVGRMQGVEVRKGSSQIKYGPYTTGGAINLISTAIPKEFSSRVSLLGGNFGRRTVHASVGQSFENVGFLLETFQNSADGFKVLDNGGPTGFSNNDYLAKIKINTGSGARVFQSLTLKVGQTLGDSDETYLGLTRDDFETTPFRRYAASQFDNIKTEHTQYAVKYNVLPFKFMDVSLTGYQNNFSRNWYKLDKVKNDTGPKISIHDILDNPGMHANEYNILQGTTSPNADALYVKANNRSYYARGTQLVTGFNFNSNTMSHDIEASIRYHEDEEDRFQWEDAYEMANGRMLLTAPGLPGTESNRVTKAKATAAYIQYTLQVSKLRVTPGLRYESIELTRLDYGKADPQRSGIDLKKSRNRTSVWIPGASIDYTFNHQVSGFAGVHRGFAPPGPADGALPEKSINYETGIRMTKQSLLLQATGFYNDYENLLGADLAASGGGGTGDLFNAGRALIYGVEAEANYRLPLALKGIVFPFSIAYTFTEGEFLSAFNAENEDWGAVADGDKLPYLANHQVTMNAGIEHRDFDVQASAKLNSAMRTTPGQGEMTANDKINANFVIDLSANYRINQFVTAFGSINNVGDSVYVVAHRPAGLRPGMPRSFLLGLKVKL